MGHFGNAIAASVDLSLGYVDRLSGGVSDEQFGRLARVGDTVIDANHPAFIVGHLSIYPARIFSDLGHDASTVTPSAHYLELFSPSASCLDDPDRTLYPPKDELLDRMKTGYTAAAELLRSTDDAAFAVENPNAKMRAKFDTLGAMHAFYVSGHIMMHVGQWSTWRRAIGLPPA